MLKLMIAAAAACSFAQPLAARPVSPPRSAVPEAGVAVQIAFAPPIGQSLRYRLTKTTPRGGRTHSVALDFAVIFERAGDGYRMTVAYILPDALRGHNDPALAFLMQPVTVRLNAEGDIVSLEREAEYWAGSLALLDRWMQQGNPPNEGARTFVHSMLRDLRALPDAERLAKLTENFAPVLVASTTDLVTGEPVRVQSEVATLIGSLSADVTLNVERLTSDAAFLVSTTEFSAADFEAAMRRLMDRAREAGSPAARTPGSFKVLDVDFSERMEIARATGLTRHYRIARIIEVEEDGVRTRTGPTMTLELLTR